MLILSTYELHDYRVFIFSTNNHMIVMCFYFQLIILFLSYKYDGFKILYS